MASLPYDVWEQSRFLPGIILIGLRKALLFLEQLLYNNSGSTASFAWLYCIKQETGEECSSPPSIFIHITFHQVYSLNYSFVSQSVLFLY